MRRPTPTYLLADHLLPEGLPAFVEARRAAGLSWRRIARDLYEETDRTIDITYEVLRRWFVVTLDDANGGEGEAA